MPYLTAAVVLVGVLGIVNLLLVIALARRIRDIGTAPATDIQPRHRPPVHQRLRGSKPAPFEAVTTTGEAVSLAGGRALVGFFSPGCGPCHDQLPDFAELAKSIPGGRSQVLAVVTGPRDMAGEFAAKLEGIASVVLEQPPRGTRGPVAQAFDSYGWPSFYLLAADGTIESSGVAISQLMANLAVAR